MQPNPWYVWLLCLVVGLLLLPVRLVVMFFPLFNLTEVILFAGTCFLISVIFKPKSSLWWLVVAAPVWLLVLGFVLRLGPGNISRGIGTGHALSLILIPAAAYAGAVLGQRMARTQT